MKTEAFRWVVLAVVLMIAGSGLFYQYQQTRPCIRPVSYALGNLDPRFNISTSTLIKTAESSAAIWNSAAGKTVLVYDEQAELKINLVYDERAETSKLGIEIAQQKLSYDAARAKLDALQAQLIAEKESYDQEVLRINARGGAKPNEIEALDARKESIAALSTMVNAGVERYNKSVATLNAKVAEFNRGAGRIFRQGEYVRDGSGERITVFEFVGTDQLKSVLAHEFGHAIGLDHNDNAASIMFALNESGNLKPTEDDMSALKSACGLN